MQLKNKFYPYPVIIEDGEYFVKSSFESNVEQKMEGYNVRLTISCKLKNAELEEMIELGQVEYVHHIECPQTCYRDCIKTKDYKIDYLLKDVDINGIVQVCSFVTAKKDILKYSNSQFSSDYKGFKFDMEKGCIMAIGNQINLRVNKIRDDLANTASIFSIVPNTDENEVTMITDLSNSKIVIMLPEKTYGLYANMQDYMEIQAAMHSMIVVPALMYTLSELKQDREQLYNYEEYRWFRGLRKACEGIGVQLDETGLQNIDIYQVAQLLMNSPIGNAVKFLANGGGEYED